MTTPHVWTPTGAFLATAERVAALIDSDAVRDTWGKPSALESYTVGGLAGHLARAAFTAETFLLHTDAPDDQATVTDAAGYFAAMLGAHHPVDSDKHRETRARSAEESADGPDVLLDRLNQTRGALAAAFSPNDLGRIIEVRDGICLSARDYLDTRLVELVVHLDDLAASVGHTPDVAAATLEHVAGLLARTAARRHGALATVRSLSRAERQDTAIRAF